MSKTYSEKLKDPRWQKKRLEILEAADWTCEDCKNRDENLQVHHCVYIPGNQPWEYTRNELMCVCDSCHKLRQDAEDRIRIQFGLILRNANHTALARWAERLSGIANQLPDLSYGKAVH